MSDATQQAREMGFQQPTNAPPPIDNFGAAHGAGLPAHVAEQQARATQEIQAKLIIAQRFPRNELNAMTRIVEACQRPALAEAAFYAFKRGRERVTGESIRLLEVIATAWGNLDFGAREIERVPTTPERTGYSVVECWAWDMQTNTRPNIVIQVPHERHSRQGVTVLYDPRDIYEAWMNQASRRIRSCLERVIPSDVRERAADACRATLAGDGTVPIKDRVLAMVDHFETVHGVTREQLTRYVGHSLDAIIEPELVNLKAVARSLKDQMATVEDFFPTETSATGEAKAAGLEEVLRASAAAAEEAVEEAERAVEQSTEEINEAIEELAEAVEQRTAQEQAEGEPKCPECGAGQNEQHAAGCAALAGTPQTSTDDWLAEYDTAPESE